MLYALIALAFVVAAVVAGRRADPQDRRRTWIGALLLTALGLLALVGALLGAWGLVYVAAMMLLVGFPLAVVFSVWVYLDLRNGSPNL